MRYLSVCSGIEAASVAWHGLGWKPLAFSEIEAFPRAVLAHHYPDVPLHGDFTVLRDQPWIVDADVLVGGTPCQAFSVAGLRGSLSDDRGNLSLEFVRLANAIDDLRRDAGRPPAYILWENVPGVLTVSDNAFGAFLAGLVGHDAPIEPPKGRGWTCSGVVSGPRRVAAWRCLDAQHFGLAQRRKRVFVLSIEHPRGWAAADALLPIIDSLSGHPAPRREARKDVAPTISARTKGGGGLGTDFDLDGGLIAKSLNAHGVPHGRLDWETETFVTHSLRGEGFDASEDGTGRGTPLVPVPFDTTQITSATNRCNPKAGDPCHPLAAGAHASAVAFSSKDYGADACDDLAPTLRAMGHSESHANAGGQLAVAVGVTIHGTDKTARAASFTDLAGSLRTKPPGSIENSSTTAVLASSAVRRLTPMECERLQGFPDNYTLIPWRGKIAPDGPRYKSLGNSMAVPVMAYIGERIQAVEDLISIPQLQAAE